METKICKWCETEKPIGDFGNSQSEKDKDGHKPYCKICWKEYQQAYRQKNRESLLARRRELREQNREKVNAQGRALYHKNPDKMHAKYKAWRENNKEYANELSRKWREDNPDRVKAHNKRWAQENKEFNSQRYKEWYEQNKDRRRQYAKIRNVEKREQITESTRQWRERNRERIRATKRSAYRRNPYNQVSLNHRRRAQKRNSETSYTQAEWEALCTFYDYFCLCCKEQKPLTVDHVIPLSKGGSNSIDNIQPLCKECNSQKWTKTTDYR